MHARSAIPDADTRETSTPRGSKRRRWVVASLAVLVLLLGGLLIRVTRPAPTHAADVYSEWVNLMYGTLAPNTVGFWGTSTEIARGPYALNQRALGMLSGVNISATPDGSLQRMTANLYTINQQLDLMLSVTLQNRNGVRQQSDARYVRGVIQRDILDRIPKVVFSSGTPPPQTTSDQSALAMTPQLCVIASTVEIAAHQRFFTGGVPAGLPSELRASCATNQTAP